MKNYTKKAYNFLFHQYSKLSHYYQHRFMASRYEKKYSDFFDNVPVFVMFLGYPRSGHTLIGALLNAHPEVFISHELHVLKYIQQGCSRNEIFGKIIAQGKWFSSRGERWSGYSYKVPHQWQGCFKNLKVIGDKRGGASTRWLTQHPDLLNKLDQVIQKDIRIIHNQRNPYDNITTRTRGGNDYLRKANEGELYKHINKHFEDVNTIAKLLEKKQFNVLSLSHEEFVSDPKQAIITLCKFIGVEPYDDYIRDAISIVKKSTHKSRHSIFWPDKAKAKVMEQINKYDFLHGYVFDE